MIHHTILGALFFCLSFRVGLSYLNYNINGIDKNIAFFKVNFSNLNHYNEKALNISNKRQKRLNSSILEDPQIYGYMLVVIAIAGGAGTLQSSMFSGDEKGSGLIDFLQDGKGYNKSNFKIKKPSMVEEKPDGGFLRNLKLPDLDFVEVYGTDDESLKLEIPKSNESITINLKSIISSDQKKLNLKIKFLQEEFDEAVYKDDLIKAEKLSSEIDGLKRILIDNENQ